MERSLSVFEKSTNSLLINSEKDFQLSVDFLHSTYSGIEKKLRDSFPLDALTIGVINSSTKL
uniref:Uncharacterized protein n=1 Tax=Meloidogyne incognita TaxID=6306 RepID=A0A914NLZ0_MELIC